MPKNLPSKIGPIFARLHSKLPKQRHDTSIAVCNIVDGMGLVYAANAAYGKLSFKGKSTSIIFGVPQMLKSLIQRFGGKWVVCWDGARHHKRIELLPAYKSHRYKNRDPKDKERIDKDAIKLRKLVYAMGIPQAYDPEVEGDDMVYFVWREMIKTYRINIISSDKDFIQLINYDTQIYNPRTNSPLSANGCPADISVEIPQHIDYLCLVGDDSDDIPGYRGCGPKTAQKFFKQFYSIKEYLESDQIFLGLTDKDKLREVYRRNRRLIDLALFAKKYYPVDYKPKFYKDKVIPKFNDERYRELCFRYNLKTMFYPAFINVFKNL